MVNVANEIINLNIDFFFEIVLSKQKFFIFKILNLEFFIFFCKSDFVILGF